MEIIKVHTKGEVINIECESTEVLDRFLKSFEGGKIGYKAFLKFSRIKRIKYNIIND